MTTTTFYLDREATVTSGAGGLSVDVHVTAGGQRMASVRIGSAPRTLFLHRDRLTSVVATTLAGGVAGASYRYSPHGQAEISNEPGNSASELGYAGALKLSGGLLWMGARVYDPALKIFLQPDPLAPFNYTYAGGDPVNRWDPTGLMVEDWWKPGHQDGGRDRSPWLPLFGGEDSGSEQYGYDPTGRDTSGTYGNATVLEEIVIGVPWSGGFGYMEGGTPHIGGGWYSGYSFTSFLGQTESGVPLRQAGGTSGTGGGGGGSSNSSGGGGGVIESNRPSLGDRLLRNFWFSYRTTRAVQAEWLGSPFLELVIENDPMGAVKAALGGGTASLLIKGPAKRLLGVPTIDGAFWKAVVPGVGFDGAVLARGLAGKAFGGLIVGFAMEGVLWVGNVGGSGINALFWELTDGQ